MSDGKFKVMNPVQSPGFIPTHALLAGPYAASVKGGGGGSYPKFVLCHGHKPTAHCLGGSGGMLPQKILEI